MQRLVNSRSTSTQCAILLDLARAAKLTSFQSGTGVLADAADGMFASETVFDDANPDQINMLDPSQPHRPVDLKIVNADDEGNVQTLVPSHLTLTHI